MLHLNMDQGWTILFASLAKHPQFNISGTYLTYSLSFACIKAAHTWTTTGSFKIANPGFGITRSCATILSNWKRPDRDTQNINYAWWRQTRTQISQSLCELSGMHRVQSGGSKVNSWNLIHGHSSPQLWCWSCNWKFITLEIQIHQ